MKILLIHADRHPWATTHRAECLKKEWIEDEVDIAYIKNLPDGDKYDIIDVLYGCGISKIKDYILKYKHKTFTTLASRRTLESFLDKKEDLIEIYQKSICCVAQSLTLTNQLKELIQQDNVIYIPNGVDTEFFNKLFIIGYVGEGHLINRKRKGYDIVKQTCDELGLELKSAMNLPYEKMPEFYKQIDCLVILSDDEGCNNPTLEALAMNIPVISTKTGIVEELEGVIIVDRDVESVKKALRKVSGRIQILEKYTWKKIAKRYRQLYVEKQRTK